MGALINGGYGNYVGTSNQIKTSFDLKYKGLNIFEKEFNSESNSVIGIGTTSSTIFLGQHFFVTGEELDYSFISGSPIGIGTTVISGLSTDKLPSTVYAIKVDDNRIRLADTAENSLKIIPKFLELNSVGVGTQHFFRSKNQNSKSLITIDNVIQSPLVSTGSTTTLLDNITGFNIKFSVENPEIFVSGDVIKIDNEIMRVNTVGFGNSNTLLVKREFVGTTLEDHSIGAEIVKLTGNYNIANNTLFFTSAPYGGVPQENPDRPNEIDYSGLTTSSTFSGRIFLRSGIKDTSNQTYFDNYIFDSIENQFIGLTTTYDLTVNGQNVSNVSENNATLLIRDIFQTPRRDGPRPINGDYYLEEEGGITKLFFTGEKNQNEFNINSSGIPLGGVILSVGSTSGSGYQPIVSAGGTAIVSISGTIQSISIGNSGSGYRPGLQTIVNVGVRTENSSLEIVGIASVSNGNIVSIAITNPGIGYTNTNPPLVVIDSPIGYKNVPLIYSSLSQSGIGTGATVDFVVSENGKIIDFDIKTNGYGYRKGDILTVGVGGSTGIQTNTSINFEEFQVYVDDVYQDEFSAWTFGELEVLDPFDEYFNGTRKRFPIRKDGLFRTIRAKKGSNIDIDATLLVFINNVLQVPGESYTFNGGSVITFAEAPKGEDPNFPGTGDKSKIFFYRGTKDIDVIDKDILETIEEGDIVNINSDFRDLDQDNRLVYEIVSSDTILTNPYPGPGVSLDETLLRPIEWCKSKVDKFIDNKEVTKDRIYNEALINPTTNIIQSVGIGTTAEIFVESVKSFFDNEKEAAPEKIKNTIELISQDISKSEIIEEVTYQGDFGVITDITADTVGSGLTALVFSLSIPEESILNDQNVVNPIIPVSGLSTDYYFVVKNSNIGYGITTLNNDGSKLSIGSTFIDNVYQVYSTEYAFDPISTSTIIFEDVFYSSPAVIEDNISIIIEDNATATVTQYIPLKVTTLVENYNNVDSIIQNIDSNYYGEYSWGRITSTKRKTPKDFEFYPNGIAGVNTSAIVRRFNPLKYLNYNP